jgi:predicted metal-dependent phosphoesterase TrpH
MIVDFHAHTRESDGSLEPQALVDLMTERGVEVFAITDHDSLGAFGRFEAPPGARVVTGVEINTTWRENEVHVLGYRLRLGDEVFDALIADNRNSRLERTKKMVHNLRVAGYGITLEDVQREADEGAALGRPHVGKALIRAGHFEDINAAFRGALSRGRPGYMPQTYITPAAAIQAIHHAGGVAVLAHPGRLKDEAIIDELVGVGLDGLEVFYPRHDAEDVERYRAVAAKHGLVMTAGSDFHDIRYNTGGVGMEVAEVDIAPFLERVFAPH